MPCKIRLLFCVEAFDAGIQINTKTFQIAGGQRREVDQDSSLVIEGHIAPVEELVESWRQRKSVVGIDLFSLIRQRPFHNM